MEKEINDIKDILEKYDISMKKLSERFEIPYRTVQDWKYGARKAAPYVLKMIDRLLELEGKDIS